jgi:hypothetical protein
LNQVDTEIHQRPATGELLVRAPAPRAHHERAVAFHLLEGAEFLFARETTQLRVIRIPEQPIADRVPHLRRFASREHGIALGHGVAHGFLHDHVLARFRHRNGVLGVQAVRSNDVRDVDRRVVRHPGDRVVAIDALR